VHTEDGISAASPRDRGVVLSGGVSAPRLRGLAADVGGGLGSECKPTEAALALAAFLRPP
jgi:hypothetical protein